MKTYKVPDEEIYSKEELELFKKIENGEYESLPEEELQKEKKRFQEIAKNTMKRKPINIRVFQKDIIPLKALALQHGLSYQTFITSILHRVAKGDIKV